MISGVIMKKEYEIIYTKLYNIYKKYRARHRENPDSKQMSCMWSSKNPPDILLDTKPIIEIDKMFEIELDEDQCVDIYDMDISEAAKAIIQKLNDNKSLQRTARNSARRR